MQGLEFVATKETFVVMKQKDHIERSYGFVATQTPLLQRSRGITVKEPRAHHDKAKMGWSINLPIFSPSLAHFWRLINRCLSDWIRVLVPTKR